MTFGDVFKVFLISINIMLLIIVKNPILIILDLDIIIFDIIQWINQIL